MISDRQALLQRAKQRIQEKRMLQEAALGEGDLTIPRVLPAEIQPLPSPTSRYRRISLSYGLDLAPESTVPKGVEIELPNATAQPADIPTRSKNIAPKVDLHVDTGIPSLEATPNTAKMIAGRIDSTPKTPKSLEKILERGVTISPTDTYLGLAITPSEPVLETEVEKKRKLHLLKRTKRQPLPDESPIKQEEIDEIKEISELYSSNSSLTKVVKWSKPVTTNADLLFSYPSAYAYPKISVVPHSSFDGFYIPEIPIITPWNYDRILRRLQQIDIAGPWFTSEKSLLIEPDPLICIHYRKASIFVNREIDLESGESTEYKELMVSPARLAKFTKVVEPATLIFELSGMSFQAHPLMLPEHSLVNSIEQMVGVLRKRVRTMVVPFLTTKVLSLEQAYAALKAAYNSLYQASNSPENIELTRSPSTPKIRLMKGIETKKVRKIRETRASLLKLLKEIQATRQLRDTEVQTSRILQYRLVKTWEVLKSTRKQQGFLSTSLKLTVHANKGEVFDIEGEADKELFYKNEQHQLEKNVDITFTYDDVDGNFSETSPLIIKPSSSKTLDSNLSDKRLRLEIIQRLKLIYDSQPLLEFKIENSLPTTPTLQCPYDEQIRRQKWETCNLYMSVYYNGHLITRTIPKSLGYKFDLTFTSISDLTNLDGEPIEGHNSSFGILITDIPRNIKVNIYEAGVLGDIFLAEVSVPIPESGISASSLDRHSNHVQFTSHDTKIEGIIKINVSWGSLNSRKINSRKSILPSDPISFHGPAGLLNLPKMIEWILNSNFDPNDPRNMDLVRIRDLVDSVTAEDGRPLSEYKADGFFRTDLPVWLQRLTLGVGPTDVVKFQKRFSALLGRFKKEILVAGPIPLSIENFDISLQASNDLRDRAESSTLKRWSSRFATSDLSSDSIPVDLGFLKRIRELQLIRKNSLLQPRHVDDYVIEARLDPPPDQEMDLFSLIRQIRPLNPYRTNRQNNISRDADHCQLVIQLLNACSLPVRKGAKGTKIKPFVELAFQKKRVRSVTGDGPFPLWNQTLAIAIDAPDSDFRADALMESDIATEVIVITLFDEVTVDLLDSDRERDKEVYIRKEKIWIGTVEIPFAAVWERSRIDGKFPISVPPSLLGYEADPAAEDTVKISINDDPNIHIFVTLDPPLMQPPNLNLKFQSDESSETIKKAQKWQDMCLSYNRPCLALTNDMGGKSTLVCRFIRAQNPPPLLNSINEVSRYVSMIPFLPNRTVFAVQCHLWSTSDQILNVGAADYVEHAILLCNYLLYLKYDAWVVIGSTLLENKAAFVMVRNKIDANPELDLDSSKRESTTSSIIPSGVAASSTLGKLWESVQNLVGESRKASSETRTYKFQLISPVSGKIYNFNDRKCPMTDITSAFNNQNIWLNIQSDTKLSKIQVNLGDSSCWKAFNTSSSEAWFQTSIQPAFLEYKDTTSKFVQAVELNLERVIVARFEEWRKGQVTRWNRLCSKSFKTVIAKFEEEIIGGVDLSGTIQNSNELNAVLRVYRLSGHPINMPYTDTAAICNAIYHRDIHSSIANGVEFALAVHCVGYPGNFISVHVFLASLVRK